MNPCSGFDWPDGGGSICLPGSQANEEIGQHLSSGKDIFSSSDGDVFITLCTFSWFIKEPFHVIRLLVFSAETNMVGEFYSEQLT